MIRYILTSEEFEDTNEVIRISKSDNTMAKRKKTNNDLQNIHIKLKIESNTNPTKNRG